MKKQFVRSFTAAGQAADGMFSVKFRKPPVPYKGRDKSGKWFEVRLSDRTGEITAKYWGRDEKETERLYESFAKGDVVHVRGDIHEYPPGTGNFSISVDSTKGGIRKCNDDEYEMEDFVASSPRESEEMLSELKSILGSVEEPYLKKLISLHLDDAKFMERFMKAPAAMQYHQNYLGGLMEHTLNVMKICESVCSIHKDLDRDLAITGAFLHDIGKIYEFEISGGVIDVSPEGMMIGHIMKGYEAVASRISRIDDFPEELRLKVLHIVLSHHGELEYGSVKKPQLPEAVVVHQADATDARTDIYLRLKREAKTEDMWVWDGKIKGHVYLQ